MNKELINVVFFKNLSDIDVSNIILRKEIVIGLDIGDKTIGISVSDKRVKVATPIAFIRRKNIDSDCKKLLDCIKSYNPKLIIFGWPLQMDGTPSEQCEKNLEFIKYFHNILNTSNDEKLQNIMFSKWDERFSTKVVDKIMIAADLSRKRRKEVIDKTAAAYILQGAIDFLNRKVIKRNINEIFHE